MVPNVVLLCCLVNVFLWSALTLASHDDLSDVLTDLRRNVRAVVDAETEYTNEWAVRVDRGEIEARRVARDLGYDYLGTVRGFTNVFLFRKRNLGHRLRREATHHTKQLTGLDGIVWAEQQRAQLRTKRDLLANDVDIMFNDPFWPQQWPLHDTRSGNELPKLDMNVVGAWKMGYTGKGVSVTILDDGIQWNHPDLQQNYDPLASYDLNDNDTDPMPTFNEYNKHGTRCAGEVAMVANNQLCGVGVAYNALIGGIRMLDGRITDRLEAEALQFNIQHVDVYSASWGPNDDGKTVEGPGKLASRAIINGIRNGRQGKGVIYIWASGNGGSFADDCDCDGYTDSIYTLSVSSASQSGRFPWYGEKCASTMAATYSSGAYMDQKITTTDVPNECTTQHTGTSASAPLAAGIVALGLEANSNLTWRDVQHITVWTSEPAPLFNNSDWHQNGFGFWVNNRFGFGLINAEAFVKAAEKWQLVPEQRVCTTYFPNFQPRNFGKKKSATVRFQTDACIGQINHVKFLEHVQLLADIEYTRRGNLEIFLVSPQGTRTQLLAPRKRDKSTAGFQRWPFMSVHTWAEDPSGQWQLEVFDKVGHASDHGTVANLTLILYGTSEQPAHYANGPRNYNMLYNNVHDRSLQDLENDNTIDQFNQDDDEQRATRDNDEDSGLTRERRRLLGDTIEVLKTFTR